MNWDVYLFLSTSEQRESLILNRKHKEGPCREGGVRRRTGSGL